jgi:hypothetical protein
MTEISNNLNQADVEAKFQELKNIVEGLFRGRSQLTYRVSCDDTPIARVAMQRLKEECACHRFCTSDPYQLEFKDNKITLKLENTMDGCV